MAPHPHPQGKGKKKVRGRKTCPPRTKQQGGETAERGRGTTRPCPKGARAELAPDGGNTGGGYTGYKGRRREPQGKPPPPQRDKCRASCLHRARNVHTPEGRKQGRPPPHAPTHLGKGRRWRGDGKGTWGGTQDIPPRRRERRAASGGDARQLEPGPETKNLSGERQLGRMGHGRNKGAQKGAREGGNPGEESGEARANTADGGGQGDKNPQETLARNPTSGVCPPPPPGDRIGPT